MRIATIVLTSLVLLPFTACNQEATDRQIQTTEKVDQSTALISDPSNNPRGRTVTVIGIDGDENTPNNYTDHGEVLYGFFYTILECWRSGTKCNAVLPKIPPYDPQGTFCQEQCEKIFPKQQVRSDWVACVKGCRRINICYYDPNKPGDLMRCKEKQRSDLNVEICHQIPGAGGVQNCTDDDGVGEPGTPTRLICCKPGMIPSGDIKGECTYRNPADENLRTDDLAICLEDIF